MSHVAIRMCSRISHSECSAPLGRLPRRATGTPLTAASSVTWACPPSRSFPKCSRTDLSFAIHLLQEFRGNLRNRAMLAVHLIIELLHALVGELAGQLQQRFAHPGCVLQAPLVRGDRNLVGRERVLIVLQNFQVEL